MIESRKRLRVALLAGTLGQGGAEKQLVYMVRALFEAGVDLRVYSLTRGEFHEPALRAVGAAPIWIGRFANPVLRLATLARELLHFQPHVIQSAHVFTNLYVGLLGRMVRGISVGAVRNSLPCCRQANGAWTRWLINTPTALIANSRAALGELAQANMISRERLFFIPNAIDLSAFDLPSTRVDTRDTRGNHESRAFFVGRLIPRKRVDRFLHALSIARRQVPTLRGTIVGDGPERRSLQSLAVELGLSPEGVNFLGTRNDIPVLLRQADMFVLCSDEEGTPNVVLEAMAARLPVISTPAGDAEAIVETAAAGFVVPFEDVEEIAGHMIRLANCRQLRRRLGAAGRRRVEQHYGTACLPGRLLSIYREIAEQQGNRRVLGILSRQAARTPFSRVADWEPK